MKALVARLFVLLSAFNPAHHTLALPAPGVALFNGFPNPTEVISEHANVYKDIIPQPPIPTDMINENANAYKNFIPEPALPLTDYAKPAQILEGQQALVPNIQEQAAIVPNIQEQDAIVPNIQEQAASIQNNEPIPAKNLLDKVPTQQFPDVLPETPAAAAIVPVKQLPEPGLYQPTATGGVASVISPVQQLPKALPGTDAIAPVQQLSGINQQAAPADVASVISPVQQLPEALPGTDAIAPIQQLPEALPGTDAITSVQQLPGFYQQAAPADVASVIAPVQQLPDVLPGANSIVPAQQLPSASQPELPSSVASAIEPVKQLPAQQLPPVNPPEASVTAIDTTSTVQNIVAEKVEDIPAANSNPISSYFNPASFYKFSPNSRIISQPFPAAQDYQDAFKNFVLQNQQTPPGSGFSFETLDSFRQGQPPVVSPLVNGFPASKYVQSSVPIEPRAVEETVVTYSSSGFKDIFPYKSYESEFEALTKDEGEFLKNSTLLDIATSIVKKMGEAQRAVSPLLVKLIEDPSGENTVQICNYSKGRLALTRAVKEFTAELSHMISVDAHLSHSDCRIKAYRAFRVLQDTLKEVRRNLMNGPEVVLESDPLFFIDEIEKLIQEGIRQITSKAV